MRSYGKLSEMLLEQGRMLKMQKKNNKNTWKWHFLWVAWSGSQNNGTLQISLRITSLCLCSNSLISSVFPENMLCLGSTEPLIKV